MLACKGGKAVGACIRAVITAGYATYPIVPMQAECYMPFALPLGKRPHGKSDFQPDSQTPTPFTPADPRASTQTLPGRIECAELGIHLV